MVFSRMVFVGFLAILLASEASAQSDDFWSGTTETDKKIPEAAVIQSPTTALPVRSSDDFWNGLGVSETSNPNNRNLYGERSGPMSTEPFWNSNVVEGSIGGGDFWNSAGNSSGGHDRALIEAAFDNDFVEVKTRLRLGANINALDDNLRSALWFAARYGDEKLVSELLDSGAFPNFQDSAGEAPLHGGARRLEKGIMERLIQSGANVNVRNSSNETPFLIAMRQDPPDEIAQWFLNNGADPTVRSNSGQTAGDLLQARIDQRVAEAKLAQERKMAEARRRAEEKARRAREQQRTEGLIMGAIMGTASVLSGDDANAAASLAIRTANTHSGGQFAGAVQADSQLQSMLNQATQGARQYSSATGVPSSSLSGGNAGSSSSDGYSFFPGYTYQCPSGMTKQIPNVPYRTQQGLTLKKRLAEAAVCNEIDALQAAKKNCMAAFNNPTCQEPKQ